MIWLKVKELADLEALLNNIRGDYMKKWLKLTLIVTGIILSIIAIITIWVIDNTRIIEDYNPKVLEIAKSIDGDNLKGAVYAYSLVKYDDKIVQTLYFAYDRTKSITTYHLKDGVFQSAYRESHYTTKLAAKRNEDSFISKTVTNNIVHGPIDLGDTYKNVTGDALYNSLEQSFSKIWQKLD